MNRHLPRLFVILSFGLLIAIGLSITYSATGSLFPSAAQPIRRVDDQVKEIAGYRSWSRVNSEPHLVPMLTAAACARAYLPTTKGRDYHGGKYVTVYVNNIGRQAMLEQRDPKFPEGSVIVKEKVPDPSSQTPELMTVMIKRGKGFNPPSGDWEYMVVDGTGTKVLEQGKLENCQTCHTVSPGSDYIFRTYLPNEVASKLK
jgi:hypothetical protein